MYKRQYILCTKRSDFMAIVEQYMDGNCKITIHDDFCVKTKKEMDIILDNIANIYINHYCKLASEEKAIVV